MRKCHSLVKQTYSGETDLHCITVTLSCNPVALFTEELHVLFFVVFLCVLLFYCLSSLEGCDCGGRGEFER